MRPLAALVGSFALAASAAGCGGSSSGGFPTIGAAKTYRLSAFRPSGPVRAGVPTTVSFAIREPGGEPLRRYRRGSGPHTGVHVIAVRRDLAYLVHRHPPIDRDGTARGPMTFPAPGAYRIVVDAYPAATGPQRNFQLFGAVRVRGSVQPQPLPPPRTRVTVGGYRFALSAPPALRSLRAGFLTVSVTGPAGRPARFTPFYGAQAHAIFFRRGTLDYFHTHVCAPGASGCTSALGGATVTGTTARPGRLRVGVLLPVGGQWRLFLQCRVDGRVLTAPFTLPVR